MTTNLLPPSGTDDLLRVSAGSSLLGAPPGDLVLRMIGGPQVGRVVRLSAAKCSIGSSSDCTLRLRGAGIEPVHCVILRGTKQTIVRRWSNDTRVNDRRFDDTALRTGDRLAVGPIEFQVLAAPSTHAEQVRTARQVEVELSAATTRLECLTQRLGMANRQGRRRLRAVLARLRKYRLRLNELEGRRSLLAQEQERLQTESLRLAEEKRELGRRSAAMQQEQDEWQRRADGAMEATADMAAEKARLDQVLQALGDREAEIAAQTKTVEDLLARLAAGEQKLAARERDLSRQVEEQRRQTTDLEQRKAAVAAQSADLQRREAAVAASAEETRRVETEVATRCEALKNHWAELIERERVLERDREQLARREREAVAATTVAAVIQPVATATVEPAAAETTTVDHAEEQRLLENARAALETEREELRRRQNTWLAEQEAGQTRWTRERAAIEQERSALDEREAELGKRRETLELAARVLERRALLLESDEVEVGARRQTDELPIDQAKETSLADRLQIEHLEALVKTWRDEAELWKSRFDEVEFGDKPGDKTRQADDDVETERYEEELPKPETDVDTAAEVDEAVDETDAVEVPEVEVEAEADAEVSATVAEAAEPKAESAADVLRRLGMAAALGEESAASPAPPPPPVVARPTPLPKAAEHHEGEESLDVYMQQLLQRLGVRPEAASATPASSSSHAPSAANTESADVVQRPVEPAVQQAPLTAGEFKARSVAAERKSDLSALRELANASANTAIAKHQVKTQSGKSKWKLITAGGSFAVSGASAIAWLFFGYDTAKYGAAAALALGALSVLQSAGWKLRASKTARSLDDVLQKSAARSSAKEAVEQSL